MKKINLMIITFLMLPGYSGYSSETAWNLAVNKDGIKVFTRETEGCPIDEFRGVSEVTATIDTIEKIIKDVNAQPAWMADCLYARVLKEYDKDHLVCYNVLNLPWPLSDRDLLIDIKIFKDKSGKKLSCEMSAYPQDIIPVEKKFVRIRDFRASCRFEQISSDKCSVEYINRVNPMAPIPDAIANSVARNNPFNTIKGLKKMVLLPKYRDKQ